MKTVMTNGCFRLIHVGHARLFKYCKQLAQGGPVIVCLNTDDSVAGLKGGAIIPYTQRKELLEAFSDVTVVTPFSTEEQLLDLLKLVRPSYLVKGPLEGPLNQEKVDLLAKWGGQYIHMEVKDDSSTRIIEGLRAELREGTLRHDR